MPELNVIINALADLRLMSKHLESTLFTITSATPQDHYKKIAERIHRMEKPVTPQKPPRSEKYLAQWRQYVLRQEKPENAAIKYLCWESEVVDNPLFFEYITTTAQTLPARAIKGLVTTIHQNWQSESPDRPIVKYAAKQLDSFSGRDRTIAKWKTATTMLLGKAGAAYFARDVLVSSLSALKTVAEQWALSEFSGYMRYAVYNAFDQCDKGNKIGRHNDINKYVLETLMAWNGWEAQPDGFRKIVSRLILHENITPIVDELRKKILLHPKLGDPRLPANRSKWHSIESAARQKFIGWLARRDIVFFFDHVLKGADRHGRREFWLRYADRMVLARPLLSDSTGFQFCNNKEVTFGKMASNANKAAFILDFGNLLAVEFSDVGKIYLYERAEFEKRIPDIWTNNYITDSMLKDRYLPDERKIRHQALVNIVNVDWRRNTSNILARYGVRP